MRRRAAGLEWLCVVLCVSLAAGCGDGGETAAASSATVAAASTSDAADDSTIPTPTEAPPTEATSPQPGSVSWPTEPVTEEVGFTSGDFELVGDLVLPWGEGPYPAVIAIGGSGGQTRTSIPGYPQLRDEAVEAGFALLSWDKPGSGESTGSIEFPITQRSMILVDGVAFLAARPSSVAEPRTPSNKRPTSWVGDWYAWAGRSRTGASSKRRAHAPTRPRPTRSTERRPSWSTPFPISNSSTHSRSATERTGRRHRGDVESWFDPMTVVRELTIPVFAVYGELDKNIDPVQGAAAYASAFAEGGHELSTVELIPGVGHTMQSQNTGCIGEPGGVISARYLELLDEWFALLATEL